MATKLINKKKVLDELKKEYEKELRKEVKWLGEVIERRLSNVYDDYFKGWKADYSPLLDKSGPGDTNPNFAGKDSGKYREVFAMRDALYKSLITSIKVTFRITPELDFRMKIESVVNDAQGNPNNLWYWIDQGVDPGVQRNRSPFLGRGGYLSKGSGTPGRVGKGWSEQIGRMTRDFAEEKAEKNVPLAGRVDAFYKVEERDLKHHKVSNKIS